MRDALAELDRKHPGVAAKVLDGAGGVKPFIRIYVGPEDIGSLSGLDTNVGERDEIAIIPAIAGGARCVTSRSAATRATSCCPTSAASARPR